MVVLLGVGVLVAALLLRREGGERVAAPGSPAPVAAPVPARSTPRVPEPAAVPAPPAADPLASVGDGEANGVDWAGVDLEEVRRALPDNLYWQTSVPTQDLRELDRRAEERERWNVEYGKVLASTATEQEIEAYYAHRQRVSEDAIEFANHLLNHYGDVLPGKDVGLLELAIELHLARLEEIPGKIADANRRRAAHEVARQAWLEEQSDFEGGTPPP